MMGMHILSTITTIRYDDVIRKEMIKLQQKYMAESDEVDEMEFL